MDFRRSIYFFLIFLLVFEVGLANTEEERDQEAAGNLVEIEYPPQILVPYRDRRDWYGWNFGIKYEDFKPENYISGSDGVRYNQLFSGSIPLVGFELGPKFNFSFGSLVTEFSYQKGNTQAIKEGIQSRMEITKMAGLATLQLDSIWSEPYFVPYIQGQTFTIMFNRNSSDPIIGSDSGQTSFAFGWAAGALIQLNRLDEGSALMALRDHGLENTYFNMFAGQLYGSSSSKDPDFKTELSWGLGLKIEY